MKLLQDFLIVGSVSGLDLSVLPPVLSMLVDPESESLSEDLEE